MYSSGSSRMSKPRFEDHSNSIYSDCRATYPATGKMPQSGAFDQRENTSDGISEKISSFIKDISLDDVLLIAVFILLLNENKQDDYLILIILAVLFFS